MGDPRRLKKKYSTPQHPWEASRMAKESELRKEYGLKSKGEIWKASTSLRKIKQQARKLISQESEQTKKEKMQLIDRLVKFGLVAKGAEIDDVLGVDLKKLLDRRLQTQVFKRGLARTVKQSRQFITHKHIIIGDKIVNKPSYLVSVDEESKVYFNPISLLSKQDHPERIVEEKPKRRAVKLLKKKTERTEKPKEVKVPAEQKKPEVKVEVKAEEKAVEKPKEEKKE